MTPKEQYESRKSEREKLKNMDMMVRHRTESMMMLDMLDRFVTSVESIAASLSRGPQESTSE